MTMETTHGTEEVVGILRVMMTIKVTVDIEDTGIAMGMAKAIRVRMTEDFHACSLQAALTTSSVLA